MLKLHLKDHCWALWDYTHRQLKSHLLIMNLVLHLLLSFITILNVLQSESIFCTSFRCLVKYSSHGTMVTIIISNIIYYWYNIVVNCSMFTTIIGIYRSLKHRPHWGGKRIVREIANRNRVHTAAKPRRAKQCLRNVRGRQPMSDSAERCHVGCFLATATTNTNTRTNYILIKYSDWILLLFIYLLLY